MPKNCGYTKKLYLCTAFEQCTGLWCNGNTADSGPAFPGSSPGSPAQRIETQVGASILFFWAGLPGLEPGKAGGAGAQPLFLFLVCSANALHSIPLGGPPGPRSRSWPHSLQYVLTCVSTCKKCRVPDTQIGSCPGHARPKAKNVKNSRAAKRRASAGWKNYPFLE